MTPRSAWVLARIRGRWTLTATSVPSSSVARWTWAVEAAANGLVLERREQRVGLRAELLSDDVRDIA